MIKQLRKQFFVIVIMAVAYAQSANCGACQSLASENGSGWPAAQESKASPSQVDFDASRISFYAVPLVCPAAREIGCGSASKPVLKELEASKTVAAAWLNRAGTVIAVQWAEDSRPVDRSAVIATTTKNYGVSMFELRGNRREAVLKDFSPAVNWYSSSGVDQLSEEETDVIGARFVRRVRKTITLSDKQAAQLSEAVGAALRRAWLSNSGHSSEEEVLNAGRQYLDDKGLAALKLAFSQGYHVLAGEK
jgi:hypothetical protein